LFTIVGRSVTYHWRTNLAITLGVAVAVAVLAGALLVGDSVRASLRDIALGRLGSTDSVVASAGFFEGGLADRIRQSPGVTGAAPLVVANGFVTNERSKRRAGSVLVYGVDERFWRFHGLEPLEGVYASPALASELETREGDVLLTRLQRPSEIPIESLFGRKDETGRTVRLSLAGVLPSARLGEFALQPQQAAVRALFAPLDRIQRDLAVQDQVNTVLVAGGMSARAFRSALRLEDLGARVGILHAPVALAVESTSGIINEPLETAARGGAAKAGLEPVPVFTYLANTIRKGDRRIPYSLITATDLAVLYEPTAATSPTATPARAPVATTQGPTGPDTIILNEWAARELTAVPGEPIEIEYYLWDPAAGLLTRSASFTLARVGLGSSLSDGPLAGARRGRALLGRISDDAEGVHRIRTRP
jgi:hypothetical protein